MALWRMSIDGGPRLARGGVDTGPREFLPAGLTIDELLAGPAGALAAALERTTGEPVPDGAGLLAPIGSQEVWAAGVTYLRSRDARMEESTDPDHYDYVYNAERPELFWKASAARVRGPGEVIGIRSDSTWDVPEPELGVVLDIRGDVVAYFVGDDVSSRSIEGENPLYLPQAKCFTGCCALGPSLVPVAEAPPVDELRIDLDIQRDGTSVYRDEVRVADMRRTPEELAGWLYRAMDFPVGAFLLTGTALVPPSDFTLQPADEVTITIAGVGALRNTVERVGPGHVAGGV